MTDNHRINSWYIVQCSQKKLVDKNVSIRIDMEPNIIKSVHLEVTIINS